MQASDRQWLLQKHGRLLSVGITAADWRNLSKSLATLEPENEWLHIDVMDGQFCSKLTLGAWCLDHLPDAFIYDVHVMTQTPLKQAKAFVKSGAHAITMQYEALDKPLADFASLDDARAIYQGESFPLIRGVSLCPTTPLSVIEPLLDRVEMVQLLTLDPRTGEKMARSDFISRLDEFVALVSERTKKPIINVDGSMTLELARESVEHGAQVVVSGSALFKGGRIKNNLPTWRNAILTASGSLNAIRNY